MSHPKEKKLNRVRTFIQRNHLLPPASTPGFTVVVGLSGGPDSVALVHILHRLGYRLQLTHCHFGLRGNESDRDADFSAAYARRLGLPLRTVCFDTESPQRLRRQSIETLCRKLRYDWWEKEYLQPVDYDGEGELRVRLCVGHHQDDAIETMLFHLMRGTGIQGLLGIPARNAWIARPLLCLSRSEILDYLKENRLEYITDSSNQENEYTRNKIRNLLLPLMEQINPNTRRGLVTTICNLADTKYLALLGAEIALEESIEQHIIDGFKFQVLHRSVVDQNDQTKAILYESLRHYLKHPMRLIPDIVRAFDQGVKNRVFRTDDAYICLTEEELWVCAHSNPVGAPFRWMPGQRNKIPFYFDVRTSVRTLPLIPNDDKESATFDLQKLVYPLHFRHWQQGDRIRPLGMQNYKLVSDLFTDAHFSPLQKAQTWVLTDANGRIAWVSGLRMSDEFRVDPSTTRLLHVEHTPTPPGRYL